MATRKEAQSNRLKRRSALGLSTGRPRKAKTAAAPAGGEHTVELDLSAIDGETLAKAQEQEAANVEREIQQLRDGFEEDLDQRRTAFEAATAHLRLRVRRALAAAREYRKADVRLATLMARAGMPAKTSLTKRAPGGVSQPAQALALLKAHPGDDFTKDSVAEALGLSPQSAAYALSACFREGTIERVARGTYRFTNTTKRAS